MERDQKEYQKEYRAKNKERLLEYRKEYYENHKEKILEHQKKYYDEHKEEKKAKKKPKEKKPAKPERNPTICWRCKNACGGCSWSKKFEPVEGWRAKRTLLRNSAAKYKEPAKYEVESYCVFECPEFEEDRRNGETD